MTENIYSRIELAKEQLELALALFLDNTSYASAITLAGAAEEVFGKGLSRQGKQSVFEWKLEQMNVVSSLLYGNQLSKKDFSAKENQIRNMLKHFDSKEDETFKADLEESACWLIVRACENASRLGVDISREREFNQWFLKNIIGL